MKKNKTRLWLLLCLCAVAVFCLLAFTACGGNNEPPTDDETKNGQIKEYEITLDVLEFTLKEDNTYEVVGNEAVFTDEISIKYVGIPFEYEGLPVTSIGGGAFYGCRSIESITVGEANKAYKSIEGNLYTKDGTLLIQYATGKNDTTFTIPDSVITIGDGAFNYCSSLESIVIPDSVTTIDWTAFQLCGALESIVILKV